jgi:hypothetical protein
MTPAVRALLLLVPPCGDAAGRQRELEALAARVRALRARGRDVRLRACRGRTAAEEAAAAAAGGVEVAVVVPAAAAADDWLGGSAPATVLLAALHAAGAAVAPCARIDAGDQALDVLAAAAAGLHGDPPVGPARPVDVGDGAGVPDSPLAALATATLRDALVGLAAEMFAGNHLGARHAELIACIVP